MQYSQKNTSVWVFCNKVADLQVCNVIKKILHHRCFLVNIAKSLKTPIWKIICQRLILSLEVFCKDFVDISYENASFGILEDSIWLQLIYFLTTITFWFMKILFWVDGGNLSIYRSNQPLWKMHGIAYINFDCFTIDKSNQVNISREIMQPQGYFFKIALGSRMKKYHPLKINTVTKLLLLRMKHIIDGGCLFHDW